MQQQLFRIDVTFSLILFFVPAEQGGFVTLEHPVELWAAAPSTVLCVVVLVVGHFSDLARAVAPTQLVRIGFSTAALILVPGLAAVVGAMLVIKLF